MSEAQPDSLDDRAIVALLVTNDVKQRASEDPRDPNQYLFSDAYTQRPLSSITDVLSQLGIPFKEETRSNDRAGIYGAVTVLKSDLDPFLALLSGIPSPLKDRNQGWD
jgi:hypothetical protein